MTEELATESNPRAVKGWSVSTRRPVDKGTVVGRAAPLLVHQTLANRDQALVCASCHRFVGTPATQLAMLDGISPRGTTGTSSGIVAHAKKRRRTAGGGVEGGVGSSIGGLPSAGQGLSRRMAVTRAPPSHLPDLPPLPMTPTGKEREHEYGEERRAAAAKVLSGLPVDGEEDEEARSGIFRCEGGAPCDDVYCSTGCREAALAVGHGLICIGGSEEGSPLFEFHRYAVSTSETYLIAAMAVAAALSPSSVSSSTEPGAGAFKAEGTGTKPFVALEGWDEPYLHATSPVDSGKDGENSGVGKGGGGAAGGGEGEGREKGGAVRGIGVSIEEAEEAWSMLTAGLMYRRRGSGRLSSCRTTATSATSNERIGECVINDKHALSLNFFLRMVRALGRHLAPISVPSPLVSYCARLVQASPETKARALPWLTPAVERAGPFGGADGGGIGEGTGVVEDSSRKHAAGEGKEASGAVETACRVGGASSHKGRREGEDDDEVMRGERGLCRLVQASTAAAAGTAESPFPPLSVVGLLPPHCSPQHSCVPNVQLEASLLPMVAATTAHDADKGNNEVASERSCSSGDGEGSGTMSTVQDADKHANGVEETEASTLSSSSPSLSPSALRVGLVALRGVPEGAELFAPYVSLSQPVEERRRELSQMFPGRRPGVAGSAATFAATTVAAVAPAAAASVPKAARSASSLPSAMANQDEEGPEEELSCGCPRCLFESDGDRRSCGREMLKILADQALEEGRHGVALGLYRASLATPPLPPSPPSSRCPPHVAADADVVNSRKSPPGVSDGCAANQREESAAEAPGAAAAEASPDATTAVVGDALHGVGVALLAAGKFRGACRAWERGVRQAPSHPALRAQADKEAGYRPTGGGNGTTTVDESGNRGAPLMPSQGKQASPAARPAGGFYGDGGGGSHEHFTSTPGDIADVFLSRAPMLSSEECRGVIKAAEDFSQVNGGWTTSRHYAVPTTDLPVHVLEPLLPWFRSLVSERLFPALAENFGLRGGAGRVFVHDAFVVRYEEGKQRHLPLHRDQSTHSFTIALNGLDQYTGGGTFFPCLGRSLRPPEGHALSFRGDILHGGDPLLSGVRYIIACFCYYDDTRDDDDGDDDDGGNSAVGGGERGEEEAEGRGRMVETKKEGLGGLGGQSCTRSDTEVEKDNRSEEGSSSSRSNGAVCGGDGKSSDNGHALGDRKPAGGKGGIEFRSDKTFSFGFGFG